MVNNQQMMLAGQKFLAEFFEIFYNSEGAKMEEESETEFIEWDDLFWDDGTYYDEFPEDYPEPEWDEEDCCEENN